MLLPHYQRCTTILKSLVQNLRSCFVDVTRLCGGLLVLCTAVANIRGSRCRKRRMVTERSQYDLFCSLCQHPASCLFCPFNLWTKRPIFIKLVIVFSMRSSHTEISAAPRGKCIFILFWTCGESNRTGLVSSTLPAVTRY